MERERAIHGLAGENIESIVDVLDAVRVSGATTRPEVARLTGLGRNVVADRATQLIAAGLLTEGPLGRSTGGRAPRELHFNADAGVILVAELGATSIEVATADLAGNISNARSEAADIALGPTVILGRVAELFDELVESLSGDSHVWGIGVGLPGPVEFDTGRPVSPPIMPGWDAYDVRSFFADRYRAPVWVDNDVNVMALGELRGGLAAGHRDVVFIKVGTGIGAGLVSRGLLHRGAQGCAGDIGHMAVGESTVLCRCGQTGCLEALAGGYALGRDGLELAHSGQSPVLADQLAAGHAITAQSVVDAALRGDPATRRLVTDSARMLGEALARVVNFFNPSLVLIGGGVSSAGDLYLSQVRLTVLGRSLPLATRSLEILQSPLSDCAGLRGAAFMVVDELLSPAGLSRTHDQLPAG